MKLPWRNPQQDEQRDAQLDAELQSHLDESIRERTDRGELLQKARDAARKEFGNLGIVKETTREMWGWRWLDSLQQDFRFALRMLCKRPGFAATAIFTLALAIGANTAIFSVINSMILRPLPYTDSAQLSMVTGYAEVGHDIHLTMNFSSDVWNQARQQTPSVERMANYRQGSMTLSGSVSPETISSAEVSGDFFPLLGVKPTLGRPILPEDTTPGHERVAVLTNVLWREIFGGDRRIIGRQITLDEKTYTVVGVMPRDVNLAAPGRAVWTPLMQAPPNAGQSQTGDDMVVVRMKRRVTRAMLNEQLKTVSARIIPHFSGFASQPVLRASPLREERLSGLERGILILLGAVGLVLLIACVNISNLLLARGLARQKEMAVRAALGASRVRLVRQLMAEGATLALAGGVAALALGNWTMRILRSAAPAEFLANTDVRIDIRVLLFTLIVSLMAGFVFAMAPAWQVSTADPRSAMGQTRGSAGVAAFSKRPRRLRSSLVVFEVALAVVLVFGAALLVRSFEKLMTREIGLQPDHVLAVSVSFDKSVCDSSAKNAATKCNLAVAQILDHVRKLPGVESAAFASDLPLAPGSMALALQIEGRAGNVGIEHGDPIGARKVSSDYFRSTGIRLLQGRDLTAADAATSQSVAIVNDAFARKFFPEGALGRRFRGDGDKMPWIEVVGVAASSHDVEMGYQPVVEYYTPFVQETDFNKANFVVRTAAEPLAIADAVRSQVWAVDKNAPIELRTLGDVMREQAAEPRFQAILLSSFASLGLLLAMIGLYGVISYGVSQRTHEIGVRSALGAKPGDLLLMILREAMTLVVAGIAIGIAAGLALGRVLQSLLYELKAGDPFTFVIVGLALAVVALAACYVPARRAMRVDPMQALRYE